MHNEKFEQGKDYIWNEIKKKITEENQTIEKHEWKPISESGFELVVHANGKIVDKVFKKDELLFCQTDNQYIMNVQMKIESIIIHLKK